MPDNSYVYKKEIDWSVLHQGVSIPVTIQVLFQNTITRFLPRGQSKDIFLYLEGRSYKAILKNQQFDERKYPFRKDILQIRYNPASGIAEKLRSTFAASYRYISEQRSIIPSIVKRKFIKIPEESKEYLAIYTTDYPDTYLLECITSEDSKIVKDYLAHEDEQKYESSVNYNLFDPNAAIVAINQITKIRKLNRAIGDNLKLLYNYRCQICGENFGSKYNVSITESHHIDPFVKSMNNNAENQIIVCPNHHRVIHKANPRFDRKKLIFVYDMGVQDMIVLNRHL